LPLQKCFVPHQILKPGYGTEANKAVFSGPLFETFALSFCIVFLKVDEPLWSRKLWSKSYVFQNKAKNVPKAAL